MCLNCGPLHHSCTLLSNKPCRPAYEVIQRSGSRWLRVLGRQGASLLFERTGYRVSPTAVSVSLGVLGGSSLALLALSVGLSLARSFGRSRGRAERKEQ